MTASMGMKEVAIRRKRTRASSRTFHPLLNSLGQGKGGRRRSRSSSIKSAAFLFVPFPLPFTSRSPIHNIFFFLLFVRKRPIDRDCSRLSEYDEKKMDHETKSRSLSGYLPGLTLKMNKVESGTRNQLPNFPWILH